LADESIINKNIVKEYGVENELPPTLEPIDDADIEPQNEEMGNEKNTSALISLNNESKLENAAKNNPQSESENVALEEGVVFENESETDEENQIASTLTNNDPNSASDTSVESMEAVNAVEQTNLSTETAIEEILDQLFEQNFDRNNDSAENIDFLDCFKQLGYQLPEAIVKYSRELKFTIVEWASVYQDLCILNLPKLSARGENNEMLCWWDMTRVVDKNGTQPCYISCSPLMLGGEDDYGGMPTYGRTPTRAQFCEALRRESNDTENDTKDPILIVDVSDDTDEDSDEPVNYPLTWQREDAESNPVWQGKVTDSQFIEIEHNPPNFSTFQKFTINAPLTHEAEGDAATVWRLAMPLWPDGLPSPQNMQRYLDALNACKAHISLKTGIGKVAILAHGSTGVGRAPSLLACNAVDAAARAAKEKNIQCCCDFDQQTEKCIGGQLNLAYVLRNFLLNGVELRNAFVCGWQQFGGLRSYAEWRAKPGNGDG
jgi:hypothetical protein